MADSLLEEAIRQHLELKRSRGADPAEVAQQEHEALGPVNPAAAAPPPEPVVDPDAAVAAADDDEPVAAYEEPVAAYEEPGLAAPGETAAFDPFTEESFLETSPDAVPAAELEPDPAAPPLPASDEPASDLPDQSAPPAHGDWLAENEPPPPAPEPDPLEGTPEFLEETPEHDRLWFEQKPPKDFDFDG